MYSIDLMIKEHNYIKLMLKVIKKASCVILEGGKVSDSDFRKIISFVKNYADNHHHGKEEEILFKEMQSHLGEIGKNLIQHGMLVEHDLGRLHIIELEKALDNYKTNPNTLNKLSIITEACGYANLLERHIDKENEVVFAYAKKNLNQDILNSIDEKVKEFEEEKLEIPKKELQSLRELMAKYNIT